MGYFCTVRPLNNAGQLHVSGRIDEQRYKV